MKVGIGHLVLLEQPQTSIMSKHFRFQTLLQDLNVWTVTVSLGVPNSQGVPRAHGDKILNLGEHTHTHFASYGSWMSLVAGEIRVLYQFPHQETPCLVKHVFEMF